MEKEPNPYRKYFPAYNHPTAPPIVYLDNAATTQTPTPVIQAINSYYTAMHGNVQRSHHRPAAKVERQVAQARQRVADHLNAPSADHIIFTAGTTSAINLVAHSYGSTIEEGDHILVTAMEHHSNLLPWQVLTKQTKAKLIIIPITPTGDIDLEAYEKALTSKAKLVACTHISNLLGTVNPIATIIDKAHAHGAAVLIDAAQSITHTTIDVLKLKADFVAFSGHKAYGPTGIGVLYASKEQLAAMRPTHYGGGMVTDVEGHSHTLAPPPYLLEAGTPHLAGIIGLDAALSFINNIGQEAIARHLHALTTYTLQRLAALPAVTIIGNPRERVGIIPFTLKKTHPLDAAILLNNANIAVRSGTHCAAPLLEALNHPAVIRLSLAIYNTRSDIDCLIERLKVL